MLIGVDIMGGDYAPVETTLGAIQAQKELPENIRLLLIGDKDRITEIIKDRGVDSDLFEFYHTTQVIGMGEHPTRAFQQKTDSSISAGFKLLAERRIDAFASAGNTGAMMVGAMFSVKTIPGILRPCISTIVPKEDGNIGVILDVGVNADCKPEMLVQFAILGSLFASQVLHIVNPKVGLMNIGEEEEKGNMLTQQAHQLMKNNTDFNFIGNIEGRDLFNDKADVIVCDGFTGNVILKEAESLYTLLKKRGIHDDYFERFNYENYGGTPILGVNSNVIIAHGMSNAKAVKNMILLSRDVIEANLSEKIKQALHQTV